MKITHMTIKHVIWNFHSN